MLLTGAWQYSWEFKGLSALCNGLSTHSCQSLCKKHVLSYRINAVVWLGYSWRTFIRLVLDVSFSLPLHSNVAHVWSEAALLIASEAVAQTSTHGKDKAAYLQSKRKRQHKITGMHSAPSLRRLRAISPRLTRRILRSVSDMCARFTCIVSTQTHLVAVKKQTTTTKKRDNERLLEIYQRKLGIFSICYRKLVQKMCDREEKKNSQGHLDNLSARIYFGNGKERLCQRGWRLPTGR